MNLIVVSHIFMLDSLRRASTGTTVNICISLFIIKMELLQDFPPERTRTGRSSRRWIRTV